MPSQLLAIVFDFDGVIVDSEPVHFEAMRDAVRPAGIEFDYADYQRELIGFDDRDAFNHILKTWGNEPDPPAHVIATLGKVKQHAFEQRAAQGVAPIPGSVELVRELSGKLPIAVASGATRADIDLILKGLDLTDAFDAIVTADDVAYSKPDPASYRLAVEALGMDPATALAIEDTAAGLQSAQGAGLRTLGLSTTGDPTQLAAAERVLPNLAGVNFEQLKAWYQDAP